MAIVTETATIKGKTFTHTYSDAGLYIERDGVEYAEAYDPEESGRTYTETENEIEPADPDETAVIDSIIEGVKSNE